MKKNNTEHSAGVMSDDLESLYRRMILEHSRNPLHYGILEHYTHSAQLHNALCGDEITLYCDIRNENLHAISFTGSGCAIMKASASLMTDYVQHYSLEATLNFVHAVEAYLLGNIEALEDQSPFVVFAGVRKYPSRIKCALLPFQALQSALHNTSPIFV